MSLPSKSDPHHREETGKLQGMTLPLCKRCKAKVATPTEAKLAMFEQVAKKRNMFVLTAKFAISLNRTLATTQAKLASRRANLAISSKANLATPGLESSLDVSMHVFFLH
jgi:hypothetical protein